MRMDALEQPAGSRLRQTDQPDAVAERRRLGDVGTQHVADALRADIAERGPRAERDAG